MSESRTRRLLRRLKLDRVDLVPAGANPGARITLFKQQTKTVDGVAFPAGDFAFVPDPESPSTWKLRLTSTPGGDPDPRIVGAAVAALGPEGFRGQRVQIPQENLSAVKRKVRAAWIEANPDRSRDELPSVLKEKQVSDPEKTAEDLQAELEKAEQAKADAESKLAEAEEKLGGTSEAELEKAREEIAKLKAEAEESGKADVNKKLEDANAEIEKLRKADRRRTFMEKAKTYEHLGKPERIAPLLEAADEHFDDGTRETLEKLLAGAEEQVEKGSLFAQLADPDADPEVTWEDRLEKAAKERVQKSDGDLTLQQAKVQIMNEDAELRREYSESVRS